MDIKAAAAHIFFHLEHKSDGQFPIDSHRRTADQRDEDDIQHMHFDIRGRALV